MGALRNLVSRSFDYRVDGGIANCLRLRRFEVFRTVVGDLLEQDIRLLDVGGTEDYWKAMGLAGVSNVRITLINLTAPPSSFPNIESTEGTACAMPQFADKSFDIVFSNSVIEHVGAFAAQKCMADEILRIGKRFFLQTPNRYFPIEPHFAAVGFQFMPIWLKAFLLRRFSMGTYPPFEAGEALEMAKSVRLLTRRQLRKLFPEARLIDEKLFGLTKSFMLYQGFENAPTRV